MAKNLSSLPIELSIAHLPSKSWSLFRLGNNYEYYYVRTIENK